jgi:transposase-like protein
MKIFNIFKKKNVTIPEEIKVVTKEENENSDQFICHNCGYQFTVKAKDIFPTSVKLLYKDVSIIGKGVLCPKCKKTSIFG